MTSYYFWFGIFMFLKKLHLIKEVKKFQTEKLTLTKKEKETFQIQVDGEFYNINTNTINISILNKALSVIN